MVIGITGGVASGKSMLARWFEVWGAQRISADEIARELLAPGSETTRAVLAEFGAAALAGEPEAVDRRALARIIYGDDDARCRLGDLMHPIIRERMRAQIAAARGERGCRLIAVEIPLLYENGLEILVDAVLVAGCSEESQLSRLRERQPWLSDADALKQIRSQLPLGEKAKRADYVVSTDRPLDSVKREAHELFDRLVDFESQEQG